MEKVCLDDDDFTDWLEAGFFDAENIEELVETTVIWAMQEEEY
jgi:hypothetical protein